jgi:endonuclease/exonuclease/phosphatase family metal-dependent hydrolase
VVDKLAPTEKDKPIGQMFAAPYSKGDMLDALADVYLGFTFWSVLTGLGLLIWYFPLWYMGLCGYEAFVMAPVAPFLLGIGSLRRAVIHNMRLVHFLALSGLVAFLIPMPELRLVAVAVSVFMSSLAWTATWWAERSQPARLEARISAFSLGLLASSVAKYACQTNNPLWAAVHAENGGWNYTGLVLAVLAILRVTRKPLDARNDVPGYKAAPGSSVLAALGFSALLFGMHTFLSDSSTMISWVWEGFPIRGPIAVPHGNYTFIAMGLGLAIGVYYPHFARSWTFYGIGAVGAASLTAFSHWSGFYGGLVLATYLMAVAPALISNATRYPPGRTFFLGFIIYNFLLLAHVWTVAYAFVPGGPLLRERTDYIMTAMMLTLGCGIFSATASETKRSKAAPANPYARKQRTYYIYILLGLQLLGASVSYLRFPTYDYTPYHAPEKIITAGIWTIHFGLDNPMWTSERRMANLIRELELDVIGLLESDTQRIIMGNRDSTQYLAEELGMYVDYGPGPNKHTWGCALLSKFPIVNSTHHLLPSPVGELAPAIHATLDAYGEMVDVFLFHSGQEEDPEDRRLQSIYLADLMRSTPRPAILLSYLVTKPGEGNYNTYVSERSGMRDIDPSDNWDRWCEYILYKGIRRSGYARVSRDTITDTELQVSFFSMSFAIHR